MTPQPRIKLSKLRDIGWELWDPIGLLKESGPFTVKWSDESNLSFADEYDRYLVSAATRLRMGDPQRSVVNYLVGIEKDYMGLGQSPTSVRRASAVVDAILADAEIWTWPDDQGRYQ